MSVAEKMWSVKDPSTSLCSSPTAGQFAISGDLYRAIEELRSVPVLCWPDDQIAFNDIDCSHDEVVGQAVAHGYVASKSGTYVQRSRMTTTTTTKTSAINSEHYNWTVAASSGSTADSTSSSVFSFNDKTSTSVSGAAASSSRSTSGDVDLSVTCGSDSVFVDNMATPICGDLLVDDVYEREMDQLDLFVVDSVADVEVLPEFHRSLPPPPPVETTANQRLDRQIHHTSTTAWNSQVLLKTTEKLESDTEGRFLLSESGVPGGSSRSPGTPFRADYSEIAVQRHVLVNGLSSVMNSQPTVSMSRVDTSPEELFEEIVESMRGDVSDDDVEQDEWIVDEIQLTTAEQSRASASRETSVAEKFQGDVVHPLTWPSDYRSRGWQLDISESRRQRDLTDCLATTLNECLDALSGIDASTSRTAAERLDQTKYNTMGSDVTCSWSSTKSLRTSSSLDDAHHRVTSSSSGFQSDRPEMDIDEEFDAIAAAAAADTRLPRTSKSGAVESVSVDSLLEWNFDEAGYSDQIQTVLRRSGASSRSAADSRPSEHFPFNDRDRDEKPTVCPTRATAEAAAGGVASATENGQTEEQTDVQEQNNNEVVAYDDEKLPKLEVLAEELITQEIVLNIIRPRRSRKASRRRADAVERSNDPTASVESSNGVVENTNGNSKIPFRDIHVHRVVRASDVLADSQSVLGHPSQMRSSVEEEPGTVEHTDESNRRLYSFSFVDVTASQSLVPDEGDSHRAKDHPTSLKAVEESGTAENGDNQFDLFLSVDSLACHGNADRPVSVELERHGESSTTEDLGDDERLRVTRRDRVKVLRAPGGSGAALLGAPVPGLGDLIDRVGQTLVGGGRLPTGVRVTCDAVQQKSSSSAHASSQASNVTVLRRTIVDRKRPILSTLSSSD